MRKIRLFLRERNQGRGYYIASVPLKHLVELREGSKVRNWDFEDGWLILEGF